MSSLLKICSLFLVLYIFNRLGLYPGHWEGYVVKTLNSVISMPLVISFQHAVDLVRLGLPTLSHLWQAATQLSGHTSSPQLQAAVSLPCACVVSGSVRLGWSSSTEFRPPLLRVVPHFLIVTMAPGSPFGLLRPKIGQAFHWGCTHTHTHTHTLCNQGLFFGQS